jgi:signal peptidase II
VRLKHVLLIVGIVLLIDQALKIYIKTNFFYGQEVALIGNWFRLHFIENEGMAFGMKFGDHWGKLFLTTFRLLAVCWGFYFIQTTLIRQKYRNGLIVCASLILAGAMGNLIDSVFYSKFFTESSFHVARFVPWGQGYGSLMHGKVVDMLYFPLLSGHFPAWFPIWAGQPFEFFRPVFNIADFSISFGVITILVFQQTLLHQTPEGGKATQENELKDTADVQVAEDGQHSI